MFNFSEFINDTPIDSILLFIITFFLLIISAYIGKFIFKRKKLNDDIADDEAKIILGAILSLLGLLIGFVLQSRSVATTIVSKQKRMKRLR